MKLSLPVKSSFPPNFLNDMNRHIREQDKDTNYKLVGIVTEGKLIVKKELIEDLIEECIED